MSLQIKRTGCCGLRIISGIIKSTTPKEFLKFSGRRMYEGNYDASFAIFSGDTNSCKEIKAFIEKNKLGHVKEAVHEKVIAWMWEINNVSFKSWYKITTYPKNQFPHLYY